MGKGSVISMLSLLLYSSFVSLVHSQPLEYRINALEGRVNELERELEEEGYLLKVFSEHGVNRMPRTVIKLPKEDKALKGALEFEVRVTGVNVRRG